MLPVANPAVNGIDGFPTIGTCSVGGEIAGSIVTTVEHRRTRTRQRMAYPPGSAASWATLGLPRPAITLPFGATIAHARTVPLMKRGLNLTGLIVWFRICEPLIVKAA